MFHYNNKQKEESQFNDYVVGSPRDRLMKEYHGRCMSSKSVHSQNGGLNKKKLNVISKDCVKVEFNEDYHMAENGVLINSSNRNSLQGLTFLQIKANQSSRDVPQRMLQHYESPRNSIVIKSKLQRSISPSPMSPTNVLRPKKSIQIKKNQQFSSAERIIDSQQQYSTNRNMSNIVSPIKPHLQNGHRRMFSARNDIPSYEQTPRQLNILNIENVKKQLLSMFNLKVLQLQSKMQFQEETIKSLESKISENNRKLRDKEKIIEGLLMNNREKIKTFASNIGKEVKTEENENEGKNSQSYLLNRIKDVESKFQIILKEEQQFKFVQQMIGQKLVALSYELITFNSSKLNTLKRQLWQFLQQKSYTLSKLNESICYLDNKLISRTQEIKELLCEMKQKVKQLEDSWTQKETKTTKQSITLELKESQDLSVSKISSAHLISNKLKFLTQIDSNKSAVINSPTTVQGSLEFSLTSCGQDQQRMNNLKNIYNDYNDMSDFTIGLQNCLKDEYSKLTDDFYYPGGMGLSSKHISRDISPIVNKRQQQQNESPQKKEQCSGRGELEIKLCKNKKSMEILQPKEQPLSSIHTTRTTLNNNNPPRSSPTSQTTIKIFNQTVNKKVQSIQELIQAIRTTSNEEKQQGRLRCYIDKTGYLKYTDSKTFVFDIKGNLIPCTEGEFWFLVTKGLIQGQGDGQ